MPRIMPKAKADFLDPFPDLRSVPPHRYFTQHDIVDLLRKAVPFEYISIAGLDLEKYRIGEGFSIDTDLPAAFVETYYADRLQKTDPFVKAAKIAKDVIQEHEVYAKEAPSQRLLYVMRSFGIFNRTMVPISRGEIIYGAVCVMRNERFTNTEINFVAMVAESLHRAFTAPLMAKFGKQELNLTEGELACLRAASSGKTSGQIAAVVGFQVDTVNTYVKSASKKLGASNRVEAIAEAIRRRLIS